jgi:hypothetical protein
MERSSNGPDSSGDFRFPRAVVEDGIALDPISSVTGAALIVSSSQYSLYSVLPPSSEASSSWQYMDSEFKREVDWNWTLAVK